MALSTGEIVFIVFLLMLFGISVSWLVVSLRYSKTLSDFEYTRGANLDPGPGNSKGVVKFKCDKDKFINIAKATVICTGTNGKTNYELKDKIYSYGKFNGESLPYGSFNVSTDGTTDAKDITDDLKKLTHGKSEYDYDFDGSMYKFSDGFCKPGNNNDTTRPQLIATYTCSS